MYYTYMAFMHPYVPTYLHTYLHTCMQTYMHTYTCENGFTQENLLTIETM